MKGAAPAGVTRALVLAFVTGYIEENGYPPALREIAAAVGVTSRTTVHLHVHELARRGHLVIGPAHCALQIGLPRR